MCLGTSGAAWDRQLQFVQLGAYFMLSESSLDGVTNTTEKQLISYNW